jgi:murein DD-endopeptidase MepM/ murein hydrolase activator NlpD
LLRFLPVLVAIVSQVTGLPAAAAAPAPKSIYVVRKGDTAGRIALKAGVPLARLAAMNPGHNLDKLSVGMKLKIHKQMRAHGVRAAEPVLASAGPVTAWREPAEAPGSPELRGAPSPSGAPASEQVPAPAPASDPAEASLNGPVAPAQAAAAPQPPEPVDRDHLNLLWPVETRSMSTQWRPGGRRVAVRVKRAGKQAKTRIRYRGAHRGIDFTAPQGTAVFAADRGTVLTVGRQRLYGNFVVVDHGNGVVTLYAHHRANFVKEGQIVQRGQKLAEVGRTGNATGPHLHFELRVDGRHRNPLPVINDEEEIPAEMMAHNAAVQAPTD